MRSEELARSIVGQMLQATKTVLRRFGPVQKSDDFVLSEEGHDRLDAICMQLIAIGESTKNLDKVTTGDFLPRYPEIEWRRVMGMRDIISHHYFDLDEEVVFNVCSKQIPQLQHVLERMLLDLETDS